MARILIIDDELFVRHTVKQILENDGHEVIVAVNGDDGLRQLSQARPDLVITDLLMPELNGIETIRELRECYPELKIIALSGAGVKGKTGLLHLAQTAGADVTAMKPFAIDELCDVVDRCLDETGHIRAS